MNNSLPEIPLASYTRKRIQNCLNDKAIIQIKDILNKIENTTETAITLNYNLMENVKILFEQKGYKIKSDSHRNEDMTTISF